MDESVLAAAYVFNITQFTTWPTGSIADSQLTVCANTSSALGQELAKLNGKSSGSYVWTVTSLSSTEILTKCNVIVLEKDTPLSRAMTDFVAAPRPVLVIRNAETASRPWIVRMFTEDSHIRFDIDKSEADRRHLSLSSRLLSLARNVL